jgi:Holliday junction resolvasome RuvABC endonuclease subunit
VPDAQGRGALGGSSAVGAVHAALAELDAQAHAANAAGVVAEAVKGDARGVRHSLLRMVQRILQCQREQERPKRVVLAHAWLRRHGQCPLRSPNDVQPPR